jgi:hypothetical protein
MASKETMVKAMTLLQMSGVKGGPDGPEQIKLVLSTWERAFGEIPDSAMERAIDGFLMDPKVCQWWPQPGILIQHLPGFAAEDVDDADEAWGELMREFCNRSRHNAQWDWKGTPSQVAAKQAALDAIGGINRLFDPYAWENGGEGQLRASFRNAYRSFRKRQQIDRMNRPALAMREQLMLEE